MLEALPVILVPVILVALWILLIPDNYTPPAKDPEPLPDPVPGLQSLMCVGGPSDGERVIVNTRSGIYRVPIFDDELPLYQMGKEEPIDSVPTCEIFTYLVGRIVTEDRVSGYYLYPEGENQLMHGLEYLRRIEA